MRRLLFFVFLTASIGFSVYVVLHQLELWDMVYNFFRNISDFDWGWSHTHALLYATLFFLLSCGLTLLVLLLVFIVNFGILGKSRRLYRNAGGFFSAAVGFSAAYAWHTHEILQRTNESWTINTLPVWAYVPISLAIVSVMLAAIFRGTEVND